MNKKEQAQLAAACAEALQNNIPRTLGVMNITRNTSRYFFGRGFNHVAVMEVSPESVKVFVESKDSDTLKIAIEHLTMAYMVGVYGSRLYVLDYVEEMALGATMPLEVYALYKEIIETLFVAPPKTRPVEIVEGLPKFSREEIDGTHTRVPANASFDELIDEDLIGIGGSAFNYVPAEEVRGKYKLPRTEGKPVLGQIEPVSEKILTVPYVERMAEVIQSSYMDGEDGERINNVLLYGPSAGGKSVGALILSSLLDLPFYGFNCGPNTTEVGLFGGFVPKVKDEGDLYEQAFQKETLEFARSITDFDIDFEPEAALAKLGIPCENEKDPSEKLREVIQNIKEGSAPATEEKSTAGEYVYALSSFIKCFAYGGVIDFAEGQLAQNQALLGALNSGLSDGYIIMPMSGRIVRRHPNCVVVMTGNIGVGHFGAKQLTQSVYSRLAYKEEIPDMSQKELELIAKQKFGDDVQKKIGCTIEKMAAAFVSIRDKTKTELRGDMSGSLDARAFFAWVQMSKTLGIKKAATVTIIPSSSQVIENQKKVGEFTIKYLDDLKEESLKEID